MLDDDQRKTYLAVFAAKKRRIAQTARVWVVNDFGILRPVRVQIGISDGSATEIVRGDVREGQDIVVGQARGPVDKPARWRLGF